MAPSVSYIFPLRAVPFMKDFNGYGGRFYQQNLLRVSSYQSD